MSGVVLTLSSGNAHKAEEIREMLGIPLRSLKEVSGVPEFEETGETFEENARIKARGLADYLGGWALADDSGLAVDALDGAPGVYSARYAGRHGDDAANNRKLLEDLADKTDRSAGFVCVLALCGPGGEEWVIRGECRGRMAHVPRGEGGFGYDPLFIPDGYEQSFAELGAEVKNRLSHRAVALQKLMAHPDQPLERFKDHG
jgi:non-canonical purine NTP pyrophosphatase (RdgB/HAM1 family)